MIDLLKTQLQETGRCFVGGLSVAEIFEIVTGLGIDPANVRVIGRELICL